MPFWFWKPERHNLALRKLNIMKRNKFLILIMFASLKVFSQSPVYECKIYSNSRGHDLNVNADIYFDSIKNEKLLVVKVDDNEDNKLYNYLIDTRGGSITIASYGADGFNGSDGSDGSNGSDGLSGFPNSESQTISDNDGNLVTVYVTVQGPGGAGSDGGDGQSGDNGGNGCDGGNISITYTKLAAPYLYIIKAFSIAGAGGRGGSGGKGGKGGSGGQGNPCGNSGNNGHDGFSGSNGAIGKEGEIYFMPVQLH